MGVCIPDCCCLATGGTVTTWCWWSWPPRCWLYSWSGPECSEPPARWPWPQPSTPPLHSARPPEMVGHATKQYITTQNSTTKHGDGRGALGSCFECLLTTSPISSSHKEKTKKQKKLFHKLYQIFSAAQLVRIRPNQVNLPPILEAVALISMRGNKFHLIV